MSRNPKNVGAYAEGPLETSGLDVLDDIGMQLTSDTVNNDRALADLIKDEAFMNEVVQVYVHTSTNESDPPHFILNVNGVNQPVFRGSVTPMRRKYLEVLARMKVTNFSQPGQDLSNPERGNALIPRTSQVYPFELRKDPNPKGPAWLAQILSEEA